MSDGATAALAAFSQALKSHWDETLHPRNAGGEFSDGESSGADSTTTAPVAGAHLFPDDYAKSITSAQKASLKRYGQQGGDNRGYYRDVNDLLAGTVPQGLSLERLAQAKKDGEQINKAIADHPAHKDYTVYRGSLLPANLQPGDAIATPRLMSTSKRVAVARDFAKKAASENPNETAAVMKIRVVRGTGVLNMNFAQTSAFEQEEEHVLGSHQRLYLRSIERAGKGPPVYNFSTHPTH